MENLNNTIEAILFALGREISAMELANTLDVEEADVIQAIEALKEKYNPTQGVTLIEVNGQYQLVTNNKYYEEVNKFVENTKRKNLSVAAQETLSIIAYNPKITKTEIENIRGVNSDFAVSRLLECGLIEEVARLNLPGRPAAYSVTNEFLRSCGIEKVEDLPDYENIKIKDEQMLVTDYEEKTEGENEAETSENTEVENEETKE
ncbi:MAG: SMC-Scp complex subunit ScpB [Clostridia bacterium]|jgi:segregation and condensation protein B|nr:SMC-Scp complex subunit ScpB [Clostridia bacterium]